MPIHIGLGSWADAEYEGVLYPNDLPAKERLRRYAEHFDRVEVNSSYYATPSVKAVESWVAQTPDGFTFDIKLHRAFSQSPQKSAEGDLPKLLLQAVQPLVEAKKLGAFLLTLPPFFGPGRRRLAELDGVVEKLQPHRLAVEFRHRGWIEGDALSTTLDYFRRQKLAWVALDLPRIELSTLPLPIDEVTNPKLAYMRLHGRNPDYEKAESTAERHHYEYPLNEIQEIAQRVRALAAKADNVHVSVNNHSADFAPKAALALRRCLETGSG